MEYPKRNRISKCGQELVGQGTIRTTRSRTWSWGSPRNGYCCEQLVLHVINPNMFGAAQMAGGSNSFRSGGDSFIINSIQHHKYSGHHASTGLLGETSAEPSFCRPKVYHGPYDRCGVS